MRPLYRFSIQHPIPVLAGTMVLLAAMAPGLGRLRMRTDGHALVPESAPAIQRDRAIRSEFGIVDPVVVLIRTTHPAGVFNVHTLTVVDELTWELQRLEGVRPWNVISLATEKGDRVRPGTLTFRRFLEPFPCEIEELEQLRTDLREISLYTGTLVSFDETATAIFVGIPEEADRTVAYRRIRAMVDPHEDAHDTIEVIGAPVAEALLGTHILEDLGIPETVLGHGVPRQRRDETGLPIPQSLYELRLMLGRHIGLVPVALGLMTVVFLIAFRSVPGTFFPLMEVGACLIFVFGLMGYLDKPVYLTVAVMPIILTAIGIADEIHIFARLREELARVGVDKHITALYATMDEMWRPITTTSVTTAVGFLSFAFSPVAAVRVFGVFTAAGVLFCMFFSLTAIPAVLALVPLRAPVRERSLSGAAPTAGRARFASLAGGVLRCRYPVLLLAIGVMAVSLHGVKRVVVQDSWINGFAPESAFYRATQFFNRQFLGTHVLLLCVDAGDEPAIEGSISRAAVGHHGVTLPVTAIDDPQQLVDRRIYLAGPEAPLVDGHLPPEKRHQRVWDAVIESVAIESDGIVVTTERKKGSPLWALKLQATERATYRIVPERLTRPEYVDRLEDLERYVHRHGELAVGGVLGPAAYLRTTNFLARGRKEESRVVPDNRGRIEWLWKQYGRVRGEERLRQTINADYSRAVIEVYMENANFVDTAEFMERIRRYEQKHLAPHGMSIAFAGDVAVSQTLIGAIVTTQVRSLIGSLVGILLVTTILTRSLAGGLLSVLPCAMAVFFNFAVMGWTGMPLGVATSMFAGMTLGIGVDFAIHLLERYRLARARGLDGRSATVDAVSATGPAIAIDAAAIALGFGVMTLSQVPANARLGALLVLSVAGCLLATLFVLPALLGLFRRHAQEQRESYAPGAG